MTTLAATDFLATAANALERMAFVITEPATETAGEVLAQCACSAMVEIQGERHRAWLAVAATRGFACEVAAGMLGLDPSEIDVDEHGEAVVAELANILGGEVVQAMGGQETALRLGLPQILSDAAIGARLDEIAGNQLGWWCVLESETGLLLVACRIH